MDLVFFFFNWVRFGHSTNTSLNLFFTTGAFKSFCKMCMFLERFANVCSWWFSLFQSWLCAEERGGHTCSWREVQNVLWTVLVTFWLPSLYYHWLEKSLQSKSIMLESCLISFSQRSVVRHCGYNRAKMSRWQINLYKLQLKHEALLKKKKKKNLHRKQDMMYNCLLIRVHFTNIHTALWRKTLVYLIISVLLELVQHVMPAGFL